MNVASEPAVPSNAWILNTHLCLLQGHLNVHLSEQTRSLEPVCSFKQGYMVPDSFHSGTSFFFFFFLNKSSCFVKKLLCESCLPLEAPSLPDPCTVYSQPAHVLMGEWGWPDCWSPLPPGPSSPGHQGGRRVERVAGAGLLAVHAMLTWRLPSSRE